MRRSSPTPGVCITCTAMFGSGFRTGMQDAPQLEYPAFLRSRQIWGGVMKCSKCQIDNHSRANFCSKCGTALMRSTADQPPSNIHAMRKKNNILSFAFGVPGFCLSLYGVLDSSLIINLIGIFLLIVGMGILCKDEGTTSGMGFCWRFFYFRSDHPRTSERLNERQRLTVLISA